MADFLGRGVDAMVSERSPQEVGDISAIFDDGAADIENYRERMGGGEVCRAASRADGMDVAATTRFSDCRRESFTVSP